MKEKEESLDACRKKIADGVKQIHDAISLIYQGFMRHTPTQLREGVQAVEAIQKMALRIQETAISQEDKSGAKMVLALAGHIERITACLESICKAVGSKMKEGILFSDKARSELSYVFDTIRSVTMDVHDVIMTGNSRLIDYTIDVCDKLGPVAIDFMTYHEERMISGLCQPKNSALYLDIVDNLKTISRHLKDMVVRMKQ